MADEGGTKATQSSGHDDTLPASTPPERSSTPNIPPPPDKRYQLGNELGRGGMGRVVEAFDTHLQRTVALKEVLPRAGNIDRRFQREVRITARLEHASIVPLYDSGRYADGRPFYVMRRVTGKPLDEMISRAGTLENRLALLPNALAAIDAVAHAHKRGVIHRDLKPQNILVGELGETVVIDWGLAKVVGDDDEPVHDSLEPKLPTAADSLQTQVGSVFGTPGFMAPEQARGDDLGPPGDVYALGATLYQLIVGRPPFGGSSATDVISSTLRHRLQPVAQACPGTPPELVTIIEKALAFEPKDRYPDASALAEDMRRFLTGQLVAAHRYTPRQRIVRFARRHRAALAVAALASVGVAALAFVSLHRIFEERDKATEQSDIAIAARKRADEKAAALRERADQLLLTHARSMLPTNPTMSIAVLKQLDAKSGQFLEEAKAIARAAVMRGVAWGLPSLPDQTTSLDMTPDAKRVVQVSFAGDVQIIDVERRRQVATYKAPIGSSAHWVDSGRKLLISSSKEPPLLLDPTTLATEPLDVTALRNYAIAEDGVHVALVDDAYQLALLDTTTKQITRFPGHKLYNSLEIAPDGSWIAFGEVDSDKTSRLVVVDPSNKVLAQREKYPQILGAGAGKLAVQFDDGIFELKLGPKPTFTPVPLQKDTRGINRAHQLIYRGDQLLLVTYSGIHVWTGNGDARQFKDFPNGAGILMPMADRTLAIGSTDGLITLVRDGLTHTMSVTQRQIGMLKIAAVPGSTRLVAASREALLVWDVGQVFPARVPTVNNPTFTTDSMLVSPAIMGDEWSWISFPGGARVDKQSKLVAGLYGGSETRPDGRSLVVTRRSDTSSAAVVAYPNGSQIIYEEIEAGAARLVDGDGLLFTIGTGRVFGKIGAEPSRELVTLDSGVVAVEPLGTLGYTALSMNGELVRGRFDGTKFARTRIQDVTGETSVVGEPDGGVLVALGMKLVRWTPAGSIEEVARVKSKIIGMHVLPVGVLLDLPSNEMMFVPFTGDRTPRHLKVSPIFRIAAFGNRIVSINERSEVAILELPALVEWTLPYLATPSALFQVSAFGGRIYQSAGVDSLLWTLPEPGSEFSAWLDELTNSTEVDNVLMWPFNDPAP